MDSGVPNPNSDLTKFTEYAKFNCMTPVFHKAVSTFTVINEANCAARCLISCERINSDSNNACAYYQYNPVSKTCVIGNLKNKPASNNPFTIDKNDDFTWLPVPAKWKNPTSGSLTLSDLFPTSSQDYCTGYSSFTTISSTGTTTISAGFTTASNKEDDCKIYIYNPNGYKLTFSFTTYVASVRYLLLFLRVAQPYRIFHS